MASGSGPARVELVKPKPIGAPSTSAPAASIDPPKPAESKVAPPSTAPSAAPKPFDPLEERK
jgi:hypothetical protein